MINYNKLFFYDYETDSADPQTANPVQIAAVVYDPRTLEPIPGAEFNSGCRPPDIDEPDYKDKHFKTIEWHAQLNKTTVDEVLEKWKTAPAEKVVWDQFVGFIKKYNNNQKTYSKFSGPIRAGYNIINYDNVITDRLCQKYGNVDKKENKQNLFHPRDVIDGLNLSFYWFESLAEPDKYNMDALRNFFGMNSDHAHDALYDTRDCANLIVRFLKLHRKFGATVKFKGAFNAS